ncbi:hypothetical protein [Methylobacterium nigriterrae]|uniref:hypothetical protein n=1 Tax=Methylobacterium nigriterrae TaxID=3127512 RepID=UPI003013EBFE
MADDSVETVNRQLICGDLNGFDGKFLEYNPQLRAIDGFCPLYARVLCSQKAHEFAKAAPSVAKMAQNALSHLMADRFRHPARPSGHRS